MSEFLNRNYENAPAAIKRLPTDHRGYPVPWFVQWIDGKPDFRVMDSDKWKKAVQFNRCWITGEQLGVHKTFVAGPMCGINRTSAEPPSKKENAIFAAKACPFLAIPKLKRGESGPCPKTSEGPGIAIMRNPGVAMLWTTRNYKIFNADGGYLINMGDPSEVLWFCEGREATRQEVMNSIEEGLPNLIKVADEDGHREHLQRAIDKFMPFVPK